MNSVWTVSTFLLLFLRINILLQSEFDVQLGKKLLTATTMTDKHFTRMHYLWIPIGYM